MRLALVALLTWLLGILTALGYFALDGGVYEYRPAGPELEAWMREERCEPRAAHDLVYFRCPRFRLP